MRRISAALAAVGIAAVVGAPGPPMPYGGAVNGPGESGPPPVGVSEYCDGGVPYPDYTVVCARFQNGQAFVTWPDSSAPGVPVAGAAGAAFRYRMYRSTSPINSGNYASATLIASYIFNNSGQLFGGDPLVQAADPFTSTYRQTCTSPTNRPMVVLSDLGTPLPCWTGLQVYTATTNGDAYYAIVATNTSNASPVFIGSVGPVTEAVAPLAAIKFLDSNDRGTSYGKITCVAPFTGVGCNLPLVYRSHASQSNGGCGTVQCTWGDYNEFWLPPNSSWQDGRQVAFTVLQDNGGHNPSFPGGSIEFADRDTIVKPDLANGGLEIYHIGMGLLPNPLVDPSPGTGKQYLSGRHQIENLLAWVIPKYHVNLNALHWKGHSMGAWGGASTGIRMTNPRWSTVFLEFPIWRHDRRSSSAWPGSLWTNSMPFRATTAAAAGTLGTDAGAVLMEDGTQWGCTGGTSCGAYADIPTFMASNEGADLPFVGWWTAKYDSIGLASFLEHIEATTALQSAHRGHAFVWSTLDHLLTSGGGIIDCDGTSPFRDTTLCYNKSLFRLDLPYIAFSNSSIDDDLGTNTPTANGLLDGDPQGCVNCGFHWTVTTDTSSALNFTISNNWMTRAPTAPATTTTLGTVPSTGGGTVAVVDSSGWLSTGQNPYALIGNPLDPATQEVIKVSSASGNVITYTSGNRGWFGTTAKAHATGETITQFVTQPTGPNGGPYATMTVDVTPRRMQGFVKPDGTVVHCVVTPFGDAQIDKVGTVIGTGGVFTITGVPINSTGVTSFACL